MPRLLLLLVPLLVVAAALTLSGCNQQVVGFSSISVNGKVTGSVDGEARPAASGTSAAQAAAARVVTIDPTTTKLKLYYGETIELDFAGSWMVHPIGKQWQWVCPAFVSARWLTTTDSNDNSLNFQKSLTDLLVFQEQAVRVPWEYGSRCRGDFSGRKVTLQVPAYGTFLKLGLQVTAYSGNLFQPPPPGREPACWGVLCALIGSSSLIEVDDGFPPPAVAPTARLIARATPVQLPGGAFASNDTRWREVDARLSTDASAGTLSYAWDLNGDGTYGDTSGTPSPAATLPAGVAIVPQSVLEAIPTGGELTVGVRVTNGTTGLSSTATTKLTVRQGADFELAYQGYLTLSTDTPAAGASITGTLTYGTFGSGNACIDADADGVYEERVVGTSFTTTARAVGPHAITVAMSSSPLDCSASNFGGFTTLLYRVVYTSSAAGARAAARAGGYSATTSIRMLDGTVVREGRPSRTNGPLAGAVLAGSYRWALPARASGTARPRGLAAFLRGRYVSRVTRVVMLGGATSQVGVGDGFMLLRGASARDLLCLRVQSDGLDQQTRIVGGRGAGAALRGETTGDAYRIPFDALGVVTTGSGDSRRSQWTQIEPFSNVMTLTASAGKAQKMPRACRTLIGFLPTPDPKPTPVTG